MTAMPDHSERQFQCQAIIFHTPAGHYKRATTGRPYIAFFYPFNFIFPPNPFSIPTCYFFRWSVLIFLCALCVSVVIYLFSSLIIHLSYCPIIIFHISVMLINQLIKSIYFPAVLIKDHVIIFSRKLHILASHRIKS